MKFIYEHLSELEHWFNAHFGWFFTNGMKSGTASKEV